MCHCGRDEESTSHFLLYCPIFTSKRKILLSTLNNIDQKLLESTDPTLSNILIFGDASAEKAFKNDVTENLAIFETSRLFVTLCH